MTQMVLSKDDWDSEDWDSNELVIYLSRGTDSWDGGVDWFRVNN